MGKWDKQFVISCTYLALFIPMIWYILLQYGDHIEILTLLVGFITGKISNVDAVYLGSTMNKKQEPSQPGTATMTTSVTATTLSTDKNTQP